MHPTYVPITTGPTRKVFVFKSHANLFKDIMRDHYKNYHYTSFLRTVNRLIADAISGSSTNVAGSTKEIQVGTVKMAYSIANGGIYVHAVSLEKKIGPAKMGLYEVAYSKVRDAWLAKDTPVETQNAGHQWMANTKSAAHYAAVAGKFQDIEVASNAMPAHLKGGYKKANKLAEGEEGKHYSLFFTPKGSHKSDEAAQELTSIMKQSANNKIPVNWLVHGEGFHIFENTSATLKNTNPANKAAIQGTAATATIQNQNVFFSNPATSKSDQQLEKLCKDAGLSFAGVNRNDRDLTLLRTYKNVGKKAAKPALLAISAAGTAGASGAFQSTAMSTAGLSGIDKAVSGIFNGLANGGSVGIIAAAAGVAAAGMISYGAYALHKPIRASVSCTFGRSNERWYENDASLLN